ncbi:MAG: protogloblin ApPgb [Clostridia bacterium]|nr:protogloblin ApPgb [Clostridia bacterium]
MSSIPGYAYGSPALPRSTVTLEDLEKLKATLLFGDDDVKALRQAHDVLRDQVEAILDVWYGFVGSQPHLLAAFAGADGQPVPAYLEAVRRRFGQWILDTTRAEYDQAWLDYQAEIGRRHHRSGKNRTDGVQAADHIPFRYLVALTYPIFATIRPFLAKKGHDPATVDAMHQAWLKSVLLQVILWSQPYVRDGDF